MGRKEMVLRARVVLKDPQEPEFSRQVFPKTGHAPLLDCENFLMDQKPHAKALGMTLELEYEDL